MAAELVRRVDGDLQLRQVIDRLETLGAVVRRIDIAGRRLDREGQRHRAAAAGHEDAESAGVPAASADRAEVALIRRLPHQGAVGSHTTHFERRGNGDGARRLRRLRRKVAHAEVERALTAGTQARLHVDRGGEIEGVDQFERDGRGVVRGVEVERIEECLRGRGDPTGSVGSGEVDRQRDRVAGADCHIAGHRRRGEVAAAVARRRRQPRREVRKRDVRAGRERCRRAQRDGHVGWLRGRGYGDEEEERGEDARVHSTNNIITEDRLNLSYPCVATGASSRR